MSKLGEWFGRAERKLDEHGRPAWIATMVVAFILAWPLGLAILGYMIWSGRMGCKKHRRKQVFRGTGNTAFDDYRAQTLARLEEEREAFMGFMDKLRRARDRSEFDQFMADRKTGETPEPA